MSKRVVIVQPNYIPWKGYFDLIAVADEFILFDDTQYTKRDWRNRNQIKTPNGKIWLTIPVDVKGKYHQNINEVSIKEDTGWAEKHLNSLRHNYAKSPFFKPLLPEIEAWYDTVSAMNNLCDVNRFFVEKIMALLAIDTKLSWSTGYQIEGEREDKLLNLCKAAGATHYLSGPAAKDYIPDGFFENADITLEYANYVGYPAYPQIHGEFDHYVTILDLLFSMGVEAAVDFMRYSAADFIEAV